VDVENGREDEEATEEDEEGMQAGVSGVYDTCRNHHLRSADRNELRDIDGRDIVLVGFIEVTAKNRRFRFGEEGFATEFSYSTPHPSTIWFCSGIKIPRGNYRR